MKRAKSHQQQGHKGSRNLIIENMDRVNDCNYHLNKVFKKRNLSFGKDSSSPSNVQWFCSIQIHHIRHVGVVLHACTCPRTPWTPPEDSNIASTKIDITQANPTRQNKKESTQIRNKRTMQQQMTNNKVPITSIIFVIDNLPRAASD